MMAGPDTSNVSGNDEWSQLEHARMQAEDNVISCCADSEGADHNTYHFGRKNKTRFEKLRFDVSQFFIQTVPLVL